MNQKTSNYPETPIWNFLENNKIPWTTSLKELENSFGLTKVKYSSTIVIGRFSNFFNNEQIEICAEIFNKPNMNLPPDRWVLRVDTNDCEKSFTNISAQLTNILGPVISSDSSNTKGYTWSFGQAELQITYWFETHDAQGNSVRPSVSIFIKADFKLFATDEEEDALENAQLIEEVAQHRLKLLPSFNTPSRNKPEYSKRLKSDFGTNNLLTGFSKDLKYFYGIQGFVAIILPIDHLESIILQTSIERTKINYFILGCYKKNKETIFGLKHFTFAESYDFSEATKYAYRLSQITGLQVIEEKINNQY